MLCKILLHVTNDHVLQLLKLIAVELSDEDLCSFSLAYRTFHDAVEGDQMIWRSRLLRIYDAPTKKRKNAYDWRTTYQARKQLLQRELRIIGFETGNSKEERKALEVLQGLLLGLSIFPIPYYHRRFRFHSQVLTAIQRCPRPPWLRCADNQKLQLRVHPRCRHLV